MQNLVRTQVNSLQYEIEDVKLRTIPFWNKFGKPDGTCPDIVLISRLVG